MHHNLSVCKRNCLPHFVNTHCVHLDNNPDNAIARQSHKENPERHFDTLEIFYLSWKVLMKQTRLKPDGGEKLHDRLSTMMITKQLQGGFTYI